MSDDDAENQAEEIVALCLPLSLIGSSYHHALTERIAAALREAQARHSELCQAERDELALQAALEINRLKAEIVRLSNDVEP